MHFFQTNLTFQEALQDIKISTILKVRFYSADSVGLISVFIVVSLRYANTVIDMSADMTVFSGKKVTFFAYQQKHHLFY